MLCHFDGKYRSIRESFFLEQVKGELENFQSICCQDSILVFPPLACQYRFLIHKWVETDPKLGSVSVGQRRHRRTVVYFAGERYFITMTSTSLDILACFQFENLDFYLWTEPLSVTIH